MFAPEYLVPAAHFGHHEFYPESAELAYDMPLHASLEDHELDFYHPLTDDFYNHDELDLHHLHDFGAYDNHYGMEYPVEHLDFPYAHHGFGLEHALAHGHPDLMFLKGSLWGKIKNGAKKVGGAVKRGAQSAGKFYKAHKGQIKTGIHVAAVGAGALAKFTGNKKIATGAKYASQADRLAQKYMKMQQMNSIY